MASSPTNEHTLFAGQIGIQFRKVGDRFQHTIVLQNDEEQIELLRSSDLPSPNLVIPAIQDLVTEDHGNGPVILGVGQSDKNHWSLAASCTNETVKLEIACRINRPIPGGTKMASVYAISEECSLDTASEDSISLVVGSVSIQFQFNGCAPFYDPDAGTFQLFVPTTDATIPTTVTWDFCCSV